MLNERDDVGMSLARCIFDGALEFIHVRNLGSLSAINDGYSREFAEWVCDKLGNPEGIVVVSNETFSHRDSEGKTLWNRKLLESMGITVPPNWSWWDLNRATLKEHFWIMYAGQHYDAERPMGVESFFDLPVFCKPMCKQAFWRKPRNNYIIG